MVLTMSLHMLLFPYDEYSASLQNMTEITKLTELSLSVAYDSSKINTTYPDMPTLGRMDFVYER